MLSHHCGVQESLTAKKILVEDGIIYCLNFYLVSIMQDHVCSFMQPIFEEVTPCPAPLIPISSQAHHDSQTLCISRIHEVLTCFTAHWAPHLMAVRQSCGSPLGITTSDHHPVASPSFSCSATMALAPVATCNYLLADNYSTVASPLSSPFKTTLQHQGSFCSSTLKQGSTEQSQKGKHLDGRRFAKL